MSTPAFSVPAGGLVVSCQAPPGSPLYGPDAMTLMARAAVAGGAVGIRANGADDVAAIRRVTDVPIVGINKLGDPAGVFITPTLASAAEVVGAGADLVAVDATLRPRPDGGTFADQVAAIHAELGVPVLADVDCLAAGLRARTDGADAVATTLSGYTTEQVGGDGPDLDLVAALAAEVDCPVVAEGRYETGAQVTAALRAGAHAVVVGTAITNPVLVTERLVRDMRAASRP